MCLTPPFHHFLRYWTLNADAEGNNISGKVKPKNSPKFKYDVALINGSWRLLDNRLLASLCNNNCIISMQGFVWVIFFKQQKKLSVIQLS